MKPLANPRVFLILGLVGINALVFSLSGYSLYQSRKQYELRAQTMLQNIAGAVDQSVSSAVRNIDLALLAIVGEIEAKVTDKGIDEPSANSLLARYLQ